MLPCGSGPAAGRVLVRQPGGPEQGDQLLELGRRQVAQLAGVAGAAALGTRLQVVQLKYVSASEMRRILEPIAPRGAIVRADDARRALTLSGTLGSRASDPALWFTTASRFWSIGPAIAQTIFDAGLRRSQTDQAIAAYDEVLKAQPGNTIARTNRAIVVAALKAKEEKRRKQEQDDPAPPDEKADEMRVDPDQKGGKKIQVTPDDMTTAGAAESWMREVQTSPADFLKLKFAIQAAGPAATGAPR